MSQRTAVVAAVSNFITYSALTILNKVLFQRLDFPFPFLCTAVEMLITASLTWLALITSGGFSSSRYKNLRSMVNRMLPLSCSRSIDVALGNVALVTLSVSYQQVVKSLIPVFVCLFSPYFQPYRPVSSAVWLSLLPVVGGTVLCSVAELSVASFSPFGFVIQCISCCARGVKCLLNGALLCPDGDSVPLEPYDVLLLESPLSACFIGTVGCVVEGPRLVAYLQANGLPMPVIVATFLCGVCMYGVQLSYMRLIAATSAVTTQILMNFKMIYLILAGMFVFGTWKQTTAFYWLGIIVTFLGGGYYSLVLKKETAQRANKADREYKV